LSGEGPPTRHPFQLPSDRRSLRRSTGRSMVARMFRTLAGRARTGPDFAPLEPFKPVRCATDWAGCCRVGLDCASIWSDSHNRLKSAPGWGLLILRFRVRVPGGPPRFTCENLRFCVNFLPCGRSAGTQAERPWAPCGPCLKSRLTGVIRCPGTVGDTGRLRVGGQRTILTSVTGWWAPRPPPSPRHRDGSTLTTSGFGWYAVCNRSYSAWVIGRTVPCRAFLGSEYEEVTFVHLPESRSVVVNGT
jgi:hypothetical protein